MLAEGELQALRELSTPAVANAVDALDVRPKVGFAVRPEIACQFPDFPPMVGFAATVMVSAGHPADPDHTPHRHRYWEYLDGMPKPLIAVIHDMDEPKGQGAFLGEVNGAIHRGLGCVGAVTDGGFRDVEELRALGLQLFAPYPVPLAGYMHIVDFGMAVRVGGLLIRPGELLHGDRHGVITVPPEAVGRIPAAAAQVRSRELEVVELYRSGRFSLEELKRRRPR
ncbi:MAG: RraA family protein [Chloroflexota bacterium]|nr:RraA family protein [Chloroflexota bacterium]